MIIFSDYDEKSLIERTWYKSSNILYSECYDKVDSLKEVKVVFNSGRCYLYKDVNVNDYLLFREAKSQGKAINRLLKRNEDGKPLYECVRLEDVDVEKIKEDMHNYDSVPNFFIDKEGNLSITINKSKIYNNDMSLLKDDEVKNLIFGILDALNINYKIKEND